ncbi:MAG: aldo/keto reductase [Furfurilactobacillus sp.]|jgi:predicted oxidoreductase|uniref:Aldo/keto reductase n=2 Tax=Furfurilactobacillus TaxID=2767882 RepID=A0ABT6DCK6_9LACO|nr:MULTISPECIES: aldo/keto reductase [Furfurilactobacillus]QLE65429.1 Oxidoreductase aldo-keto reductase [Furfurilactobacillus rossiae]MCF6160927.1 aldo/keto reductase [Furfurilactobacillus milii]MCF6163307.1 aldo/keto reductase [Furfurilactobacillus milii]MCH4011937.1 aldo/keto reductase [Furfurilactobacillus sp.]MCH4037829.1 aldo/keto reductase [Furfurilactobacillus sp.]
MKQRNIGGTNFKASAVALGIMRMEALSAEDAAKALDSAYDAGINYIDSADIYGMGNSEKVFKQALAKSSVKRDQLYIQSKGGIIFDPARSHGSFVFGQRYDFSKQHLIESVDGILERMGIDYLDAFLLHRPDPLMEPEEIAAAFDELQASGKVRHFGVSNFNPEQIEMVQAATSQRLLINQLQFSIMHSGMIDEGLHVNMTDDRSVMHDGGLLEYSRRKHMTVQTWSPFQYGFFDGTFINNDKFKELNDKLQELADKYGVSKNAIATAWILRHPANMQVLLGTMTPAHIVDSAMGADVDLTKQEWYDVYFAAGNDLP